MHVSNETVLSLLIELKGDVERLDAKVDDLTGKINTVNDDLANVNETASAAKDLAQGAANQVDNINDKDHSKLDLFLYAWVPLLVAFVSYLLPMIHIK